MDLAFLLDGSGTMKHVYPYAKAFIMMLAEEFHLSPNHTHIGIIVFSETAILEVEFDKHQDIKEFQKDVDKLDFVGHRTHLDIAFDEANTHLFNETMGARPDARKVMIVLSDGHHNKGPGGKDDDEVTKAQKASKPLLDKNVTIVVIGLYGTVKAHPETLAHIAGNRKENVLMIAHAPDLLSPTFLSGLVYQYCGQAGIRARGVNDEEVKDVKSTPDTPT